VVANDPFVEAVPGLDMVEFDRLLESCNIVSLHLPLSEATRHYIDESVIARMRQGAYLVNTARGGLVDTAVLAAALQDGRLAGAALDVLEAEPVGADDSLLSIPNLILTPHAAFYSEESIDELKRKAATGIVTTLLNPTNGTLKRVQP